MALRTPHSALFWGWVLKLRIALGVAVLFAVALTGLYLYSTSRPRGEAGRVIVPEVLHAGDTDFDYYRTKVAITEPLGEVATNLKGDRIAVISGTLVNEGDQRLEAVELKVTLRNRQGQALREEIKTPVQPGLAPHKPLGKLDSRPFTFWVENIPQEWDPRRVDLYIHGLKFVR